MKGNGHDNEGAGPEARAARPDEGQAKLVETPEEEIRRLRAELEARAAEAAANYDSCLRATAELENYRKRAEREKADIRNYANETLVAEMLPVADNLERALEHAAAAGNNVASLREGVELTVSQMFAVLRRFGLEEIKAVGERFDPAVHHAISHEDAGSAPSGVEVVVKEFQKGYTLRGRLLRASMVAVSTKAAEGSTGS